MYQHHQNRPSFIQCSGTKSVPGMCLNWALLSGADWDQHRSASFLKAGTGSAFIKMESLIRIRTREKQDPHSNSHRSENPDPHRS